jgi:hypothetical protein
MYAISTVWRLGSLRGVVSRYSSGDASASPLGPLSWPGCSRRHVRCHKGKAGTEWLERRVELVGPRRGRWNKADSIEDEVVHSILARRALTTRSSHEADLFVVTSCVVTTVIVTR